MQPNAFSLNISMLSGIKSSKNQKHKQIHNQLCEHLSHRQECSISEHKYVAYLIQTTNNARTNRLPFVSWSDDDDEDDDDNDGSDDGTQRFHSVFHMF